MDDGKEIVLTGGDPVITSPRKGDLHIEWPLESIEGTLLIDMNEGEFSMILKSEKNADWFMELGTADKKVLPFTKISRRKIDCESEGFNYSVKASKGTFASYDSRPGFKIYPKNNQVVLKLSH